MSWDEGWQPGMHSYKSDCGLGDHTTWEYAMMTSEKPPDGATSKATASP